MNKPDKSAYIHLSEYVTELEEYTDYLEGFNAAILLDIEAYEADFSGVEPPDDADVFCYDEDEGGVGEYLSIVLSPLDPSEDTFNLAIDYDLRGQAMDFYDGIVSLGQAKVAIIHAITGIRS